MRRTIAVFLAIGLLAAACTDDSGDTTPTTAGSGTTGTTGGEGTATTAPSSVTAIAEAFDPTKIRFEAALERFDSCDALLGHFQTEAKERVTAWGLDGGGRWFPVFEDEVFAEGEAAFDDGAGFDATTSAAASVEAPQGAGVDFSGTNVQVVGVDEPDMIKTDGRRIVAVVDNELYLIEVNGDESELLGSLRLTDGWNHRLFVIGESAFVFSSGEGFVAMPAGVSIESSIMPFAGPSTVVAEIDLSNADDLKVVRSLTIEGQYLSARSIDGTVRVAVSSYPSDLPFVYPSGSGAEDIALDANRRAIDASTLEDWLPEYKLVDENGNVEEGLLVACDRTHRPAEFAGFDTLSVLTFDASSGLGAGGASAVIAEGQTVYASTQALYVATNIWIPSTLFGDPSLDALEETYQTAVHKFDISTSGPAEYTASGSVQGHLLNQFSMDEYDGNLRIATTKGAPWGFSDDSESFIAVLEQQGDQLQQVGLVGDMGRGEQIFSVRFVGETAYVVTFRQTDPFYVVDLRDPRNPAVTGELKIPGYSAYLHPIGEGRIIGVGQDATDEGFTTGAKVSLFDVSDPTNPVEVSTWVMENSYTDVEWDHHAFLYWPPEDLLVLPVQDWSTNFTGAVVLKTDDGLREFGRISHELDLSGPESECEQYVPAEDFWEPGMVIQVCTDTEQSAIPGHYCEELPAEEAEWISDEFFEGNLDLGAQIGPNEHIELCWPEYEVWNPIQRSLVIGDNIWTLSWRALQSNTMESLDLVGQIPLG